MACGAMLTQSAKEIDEAAMNVKSCWKVSNGLLYRTVSLKQEEVRLYTTKGGAQRGAAVSCCAASLAWTHRQDLP
jgi:hypothetical protein